MTQWSPEQDRALIAVDDWYKNRRNTQQVYRLFGPAGTGKSTLAKHFATNIDGTVRFATFTGKAAHVMASKGCVGASTIHKLIYRPKIMSKHHLKLLESTLNELKAEPEPDMDRIDQVTRELKAEQQNVGRMSFSLNLESDLKHAKLLIVDEVSMVSKDMGMDLESYGIPILVLGDPEQLPPVFGSGYFTEQNPDFLLTEIHRQALDNPIIAMSKIIREGGTLQLGNYGSSKVIDYKLSGQEILDHNIILTGLRKTKKACDDRCRILLNKTSAMPQKYDLVMCVKNDHSRGLLNGQIWECLDDSLNLGDDSIVLNIQPYQEEGEALVVTTVGKLYRGEKIDRWDHEEDLNEFEYAYAITVHKAQGSQWNKVLLFDQKEKFLNWSARDRRRWLYTGITRAAESVTVVRL